MAAEPFVISKAQTYSLSITSSGFQQHTEGLHKQDTDGGNLQGDEKWQESSVAYCCWSLSGSSLLFKNRERSPERISGPSPWVSSSVCCQTIMFTPGWIIPSVIWAGWGASGRLCLQAGGCEAEETGMKRAWASRGASEALAWRSVWLKVVAEVSREVEAYSRCRLACWKCLLSAWRALQPVVFLRDKVLQLL